MLFSFLFSLHPVILTCLFLKYFFFAHSQHLMFSFYRLLIVWNFIKKSFCKKKRLLIPALFSQIMRFDTSMENLMTGIGRSESYVDLNNPEFARTLMNSSGNLFAAANSGESKKKRVKSFSIKTFSHIIGNTRGGRHSFSGKSTTEDPLNASTKPFGLGKLHDSQKNFSFSISFHSLLSTPLFFHAIHNNTQKNFIDEFIYTKKYATCVLFELSFLSFDFIIR